MGTQKIDRRRRILDSLRLVEALIKGERLFHVRAFICKVYASLLAPEKIRTKRDKPMGGIPVGDAANIFIDAKYFLEHDNTWSVSAGRQSQVAIKLTRIERFDCDHSCGW